MAWLTDDKAGCRLTVYVQPRARRSAFCGTHGDAVKVALDAPPVDGRANDALTRFLAEAAAIPASRVRLLHGDKSRLKVVQFDALAASELSARLAALGVAFPTTPPEATTRP